MKKIFTTVLLGLFLISTAYSTNNEYVKANNSKKMQAPKFEMIDGNAISVPTKNDKVQGATWTKISDVGAPTFYLNSDYSFPIAYEPYSKTVVILESRYGLASQSDASYTGYLGYRTTKDYKTFSSYTSIFQTMGSLPTLPSVSVYNPKKSTNSDDIKLYVFSTVWTASGSSYSMDFSRNWSFSKGLGVQYTDIRYPEQNPDNNYWWDGGTSAFTDGKEEYGYVTSRLQASQGTNFGNYGFGIFDIGAQSEFNLIPQYWGISNFKSSATVGNTYNGNIYTDVDKNGNLYSAVLNMFATNDQIRTLGVSKSTNNGEEWSNWDQMPQTMFTTYVTALGSTDAAQSFYVPYFTDAFKVTGVDSYSYLVLVGSYNAANDYTFVLTEVAKENGTWQMSAVAQVPGLIIRIIRNKAPQGVTSLLDSLDNHSKDNEYQLSMTADGQYLVAKWLDYSKWEKITQPCTLNGGQQLQDSILTTDVFMSYKKIGDNQWSNPINVTNDDLFNKFTYIPKTIENISNIPMVSLQTRHVTGGTSTYETYPEYVFQRIADYNQSLYFTKVDLLNPGTSVEETKTFDLQINSISPNPVSEATEIAFTVNNSNNVKLEVYNQLGQLVKVILNGKVNIGYQAINAKFDDLTSGTYFLKLSDGTNTISKNLVIVK